VKRKYHIGRVVVLLQEEHPGVQYVVDLLQNQIRRYLQTNLVRHQKHKKSNKILRLVRKRNRQQDQEDGPVQEEDDQYVADLLRKPKPKPKYQLMKPTSHQKHKKIKKWLKIRMKRNNQVEKADVLLQEVEVHYVADILQPNPKQQ